ncbi:hypothetical protein RHGRI_027970 [Rhododendron griersonianum]|uniref:DUF599 domain-containing protein n=1 Tax=Rhododendron griersonianum TaxID=479676 RepID=A0AAV6J2F2_9ERIC|nr:hypothetical protein RHGRI_027970 [Rhododendron griersonianum]
MFTPSQANQVDTTTPPTMEAQILDYTLVPLGLLIMVGYHIWLLYQVVNHPSTTVIGFHAINRRFWVSAMMEESPKNGVLAVQTLRNNIMASTLLASMAIMLSSLIAVLMSNQGGYSSPGGFVYGDKSELTLTLKFFSILVCFLLAFLFNVQSIRYYSHASILINVPLKKNQKGQQSHHHHLTVDYVGRTVNRGGYFWALGLRAFYFSLPLFLWIFGPIPAFVSCFVLVLMFYFLDVTFDFRGVANASDDDHHHHDEEDVG